MGNRLSKISTSAVPLAAALKQSKKIKINKSANHGLIKGAVRNLFGHGPSQGGQQKSDIISAALASSVLRHGGWRKIIEIFVFR